MTIKTVLVIDDSKTIRQLVSQTLENAGYAAVTANDGAQGLSEFGKQRFDIVLTDINMPVLDGFGVMEGIRAGSKNRHVPILALTTEGSQEFRDRARDLGATGWILKPYEEKELVDVLDFVAGVDR